MKTRLVFQAKARLMRSAWNNQWAYRNETVYPQGNMAIKQIAAASSYQVIERAQKAFEKWRRA